MEELLHEYQNTIAELTLVPSSGGVFEVSYNGSNLFSKKELGRFPEDGEIIAALAGRGLE